MVSAALLINCTAVFAQSSLTAHQTFENYLQAVAKGENAYQYFQNPITADDIKRRTAGMKVADQIVATEVQKAISGIVPKVQQQFLKEASDGDITRLYYGNKENVPGYTEIVMVKVGSDWKIRSKTYNQNCKLPTILPNQKSINTAYGALKKQFPKVPVHGKFNGVEFKPTQVNLWDKHTLSFAFPRVSKYEKEIKLWFTWYDKSLINRRISQSLAPNDKIQTGAITVWMEENSGEKVKVIEPGDFGLQLFLSPKDKKGLIPGYIILQTSDPNSYLEGYFYAVE